MRNEPKENLTATHVAMVSRIFNSSLAQAINPFQKKVLDNVLIDLELVRSGWSNLAVQFNRAGTQATLEVRNAVGFSMPSAADLHRDEAGNDLVEVSLKAEVNFPSHGSADPATVLARCKLYAEVAMLAAEIQAEFLKDGLWAVWQTPEERAAKRR